jgi:GTP-binding protein YchF
LYLIFAFMANGQAARKLCGNVAYIAYFSLGDCVMEVGLIGLPYIGKTTVFNALTALGADAGGGAAKPNIGVVQVPDPRLHTINKYIETKKITHATIQIIDIAGLVSGSSKGQGMGNKFLSHIRDVDAIVHVVRCFEDDNVHHVNKTIDAARDCDEVETELILADLEVVEKALPKAQRNARTGDKQAKRRLEVLEQCYERLGEGLPIRALDLDEESVKELRSFSMLTAKPVLYVANVGEDDLSGEGEQVTALRKHIEDQHQSWAAGHGDNSQPSAIVVPICAKLEAELAELEDSERQEMLDAMGLSEPALNVLARACYRLMGLQSFFTAGIKEIRAWTIRIGATGPEAAGAIHSDMQRGFIRVETHSIADLEEYGTEQAIKNAGKLRVEGKNYVMQDGDVCHILFNV